MKFFFEPLSVLLKRYELPAGNLILKLKRSGRFKFSVLINMGNEA